ncbi:hypothetical protein [Streptomyces justiciae]|uniref:Uncharacterized protein n=1 Tax=Streptomyces justiciae TaxID=2780140 RepID=A0ABU3M3V2_9ACTN|nr:hypothetical protein [Streptomyces justiciae]MDT7845629.1 hypothetical protein [Streptomyces justiciae]
MPVTHCPIHDEKSFEEATGNPNQLAAVYFYLQLDNLVGCASHIAHDFFRRPQLYTALGDRTTAGALARLHSRYGSDERVPSQEQREQIYTPLFGAQEGPAGAQGDFARLRDNLLEAAAAFAERVYDTGVEMLRERVRTAHRPLRDYLSGLHGDSVVWSAEHALTAVTRSLAYPILRDPGVAAVFGMSTPPRPEWPFVEDPNADKLIEEIAGQLLAPAADGRPALTRQSVSNRQRAALRGAEALTAVLEFREEDDPEDEGLTALITRCYTWGSALRSLSTTSVTVAGSTV